MSYSSRKQIRSHQTWKHITTHSNWELYRGKATSTDLNGLLSVRKLISKLLNELVNFNWNSWALTWRVKMWTRLKGVNPLMIFTLVTAHLTFLESILSSGLKWQLFQWIMLNLVFLLTSLIKRYLLHDRNSFWIGLKF